MQIIKISKISVSACKSVFKSYTFLFLTSCIFCNLNYSQAQSSFTGISNSDYGALNQLFLNPANIVNIKNAKEIKILQADANFINNYTVLKPIWNLPFKNIFFDNKDSNANSLKQISAGRYPEISSPLIFAYSLDIQFLSYFQQFVRPSKKSFSIALNLRHRTLSNFNNLDRNLYQLIETNTIDERITDQLKNYVFKMENLKYSLHKFAEIGVTYASEILKKNNYILSAGITAKRLIGIYHEGFKADDLYLHFKGPRLYNDYTLLLKNSINFNYSNKEKFNGGANSIFPISDALTASFGGWGGDFGLNLTYYPKSKTPVLVGNANVDVGTEQSTIDSAMKAIFPIDCYTKYKIKFSASIIDAGYVKYGAEVTDNFQFNIDSAKIIDWNTNVIGKSNSFNAFLNTMLSDNLRFSNSVEQNILKNYEQPVYVYLPMKLHLAIDFPLTLRNRPGIWKHTYINLAYNQNMFDVYGKLSKGIIFGNQIYSHAVASIRYQTKNLDFSIPITTYTTILPAVPFFNIGLATRYKHFSIGTSNLASLFGIPYTQNANIYAGISYVLPYLCPPPPPDDTTTDEIKNGYKYKDKDGDKIPDNKDKCPELFGDVSNFGCPIDPDSILNRQISELAGRLKFIIDKPILQPSSDLALDSLKKLLDKYPKVKLILSGKPDSIQRLYDFNKQLALSRDSVLREEIQMRGMDTNRISFVPIRPEQPVPDHIPIIRKLISGKDEDRDGIFDSADRCPYLVGSTNDEGCTFIDQTDNNLLATSLGSKVEFWKGLKNFAYNSEQYLDEVANIMKAEKDIRVLVRGFVGREILSVDYKYELSQKRADTIKSYLIQKGIEPNRIIALGMSPYEPYNSVPIILSLIGRESIDTDYDKVLDTLDRCPTLKGKMDRDGCPRNDEIEKLLYLDSLSQKIEFEEDNDVFKPKSIPVLLKLYDFLNKNQDQTVAISPGVVSSTLTNAQKEMLSQNRAFKIKNYLKSLGIDQEKLIVRGLGYQQPLSAINTIMPINSRLIDGDQDEVKDYEDKCPTIKGSISNYGCPQVNDEDLDLLARINRNLIFNPNTSIVKEESAIYLDSLVWFMAYNPNTTIIVSGNVANASLPIKQQDKINNERAQLIRNYLLLSGVSKNRVTAVGLSHLEEKPWLTPSARVADNLMDIDNDLTKDVYDKCPNTPGSTFNFGCPYQLTKIIEKLKKISNELLFDFDKYDIKPKAQKVLKDLAVLLQTDSTLVIIVSGHADTTGTKVYNEVLSLNRANEAKNFIIRNTRIRPERLTVIGLGDKFPIADNKTAHGREQNRRVSIFLIE